MPTLSQYSPEDTARFNLIAAQYVLGTLSVSARLRFQTLMQQQPALRQMTHAWERRLNPMAGLLQSHAVPEHVWQQIEAKLDSLSDVTQRPVLAMQPSPSARPAANDAVSMWRPWAWASTAIAAGLAVFIALQPQLISPPSSPVVQAQPVASRDIAVLSDDSKQPAWIVRQQGNALVLSQMNSYQVPSDRDLELWSIQGNAAPQSLGVVRLQQGKAILSVTQARLLPADAILAISLEPKNGSPTGLPTGSVLYTGKVV